MKKAYDRHDAKRLVPLLEAITSELSHRLSEVQRLEDRVERPKNARQTSERIQLQAELAVHRREVRLCRKELESLGCVNDESHPTEVLIPGRDGNLEHGYRWHFGDESIHAVASDQSRA